MRREEKRKKKRKESELPEFLVSVASNIIAIDNRRFARSTFSPIFVRSLYSILLNQKGKILGQFRPKPRRPTARLGKKGYEHGWPRGGLVRVLCYPNEMQASKSCTDSFFDSWLS